VSTSTSHSVYTQAYAHTSSALLLLLLTNCFSIPINYTAALVCYLHILAAVNTYVLLTLLVLMLNTVISHTQLLDHVLLTARVIGGASSSHRQLCAARAAPQHTATCTTAAAVVAAALVSQYQQY
jgi:hypothetical protein